MIYKIKKINKVIVALSGGVDSSVTAWILKQLGYHVECVFMKCWEENDNKNFCNSMKDYKDAKKICILLNIKLHKINFSTEYWNKVFKIFIKEQKKAKTPNPDILCNKEIKFNIFLKFSLNVLKGKFISTGHYVIKYKKNKNILLLKGKDKKKDQSYFLYILTQKIIKKCIFPLGYLYKKNVRKIAKNLNLINYNKKSSKGICFIGKKNYFKFIKKYINIKPGKIINTKKKYIGKHLGLSFYTIGQRKNLNINNRKTIPFFVTNKNIKYNQLIVAEGIKNKNLYSKKIYIKKIHFINPKYKKFKKIICNIKIRHQQKENIKCKILINKKIKIILKKKIFAITPGQSAVFYRKNICLGGGIIKNK